MQIIDGRTLAASLRSEMAQRIAEQHLRPKLAVLLVGDDQPSHLYVNLKEKAATEVGIETDIRRLPSNTTTDECIRIITSWNADPAIHGILVQLPLPAGMDETAIISTIAPHKDVDGFHPSTTVIPPVHEGILRLIAATDVAPNHAHAVVIGNSDIFTAPLVKLLQAAGAIVTTCAPDDLDRAAVARANIIVIAIGRAGFLNARMISSGACIIDVGTNRTADGKVVGDVDADSLKDVPGWLSPVPGGVGPMTIALLLKNVTDLAEKQTKETASV